MSAFVNLILALQILTALAMIGLILIQHGKGADMGAAFGSGGSGSLFGASGSANFLSRTTAVLATVFFLSTLSLAYLGNQRTPSVGSVLEAPAAAVPAAPATPAPAEPAASTDAQPAPDAQPPADTPPEAPAAGAAQIPTK
ncbi:protein translocase subunit secG [Melaminivora alkalimesophila]|uniref:Protein-export membrane protein SecG n=1 Tax=Melaminivora alkalimesophila TaxID=1165852 RepID=A0A317RFZ8_9BURK|nr:preprotein translocase subunit SecG [Melaminivora alkalimesophila]PWW48717.1 protein translocase subunit secG [Melaminivora alkalimesophila]